MSQETIKNALEVLSPHLDQKIKTTLEANHKDFKQEVMAEVNSKAESLEQSVKERVLDEASNLLDQRLAKSVQKTSEQLEWKESPLTSERRFLEVPIRKAVTAASPAVGSGVTGLDAFASAQTEAALKPYVTVFQLSESTGRVPRLANTSFSKENTGTALAAIASLQGSVTAEDVTLDRYTQNTAVVDSALDDVAGLTETIVTDVMGAWGDVQGGVIAATSKASVNGSGFGQVKTGAAAALPAKGAWVNTIAKLLAEVEAPYHRNATWAISRGFLASAIGASDGGYAFDVATGVRTIAGYPVVIDDSLDSGGTANDVSALFGDLRRGIILAESSTMRVAEPYTQTLPGFVLFHSSARTASIVRDPKAVAGLTTAA